VTYFMADSLWLGTSHTRTPRIDWRARRQHYTPLRSCRCCRVCAGGGPDHRPEGAAESSEIHRARPARDPNGTRRALGDGAQRDSIKANAGRVDHPPTQRSLKALELLARLNGGTRLAAPDVASPEAGIQGDVASGHTKLRGGR
jgi:hypothetical protein